MSESFAELFEESLSNTQMIPGSIVVGTVVDISSDYVTVSAGLKSESEIPIEQFQSRDGALEVQLGDQVEVAMDMVDDGYGETRLSREKAKRAQVWSKLEKAYEDSATITGVITGRVKGGFTVESDTIRAFLPGSLVDVRPVRDPGYLEDKELEFKVIKIDRKRNNVVVSRRAVVEEENSAEREALLSNLNEGSVVKGVVKNLTDYGAFIDLGGVDGLLHITDMAWKRVKHPSEVVAVGDEIDVMVLKFDRDRNRVSLGLKQIGEDPWQGISRRYPIQTRIFGTVTNIADYGCFVEIEPGVEGLVHVSEMDWTNKNIHPSKVVHVGDEVEVMVLDIDDERRRISLGLKQCTPNPWEAFAEAHQKGDVVTGTIKSITDFGIFVGFDEGHDGLIHMSDISWTETPEDIVKEYKKGDEIEAIVLYIDTERERISLGLKQRESDPFSSYIETHPKGSIVTGEVTEVDPKLVTVTLAPHVLATVKLSELSRDHVEDARTAVNVGDEIEAKMVAVDARARTITLSVKAKDTQEEKEALRDYSKSSDEDSGTTLGDIFKDQFENR